MTSEFWQKVKEILNDAIGLPPEERAEFLAAACAGDAGLRREVESLLEFDGSDDSPFDVSAYSFGETGGPSPLPASLVGKKIGNYVILDELGSGGMGAVFLANRADGEFEQKVALKLIKRGMDSDAVLRRFFNERQILASLKHRYIARLLDGGTTDDGVPYFVMEYVEGKNIMEYADQNNLDLKSRLIIFRDICTAVTLAHRNLIIHRDLKPSNILVNGEGNPKLLDFGIAKMLSGGNEGFVTATRQLILTPEYSSPEQLRGEQLTTASDIYSLGVLLYQLLTGVLPYKINGASFGEVLRVVCETEAPRPSVLKNHDGAPPINPRDLRGDIENIVLKAIRKEPERRYSSVEQLSGDIKNYLDGRPVSASRDSWGYRTGKFIRRHVIAVSAAVLILFSLLGGMGATLYQAELARRERARAEKRFEDVRQLTNSIMFEMNDKIRESPIRARELLVTRALEYLERLSSEGQNDSGIQSEMASAYEKIGEVQAGIFDPSLGKSKEALASHQRALDIRERLFAESGRSVAAGLDVIKSRMAVGDIYSTGGRLTEARDAYRSAISLGEGLLADEPQNVRLKMVMGSAHGRFGQAILRSGSLADALGQYQEALRIYEELAASDPSNLTARRSIGVMYCYIGYVKLEALDFREATRYFQMELQLAEELSASDSANIEYLEDVTDAHYWLSVSLTGEGRIAEGLAHIATSIGSQQGAFDADPANLGIRNGLADSYLEKGKALTSAGRFDEALSAYSTALGHYEAVSRPDPQNLSTRRQIVMTRRLTAETLAAKGETEKALALFAAVLTDYEGLVQSDPANTEWQDDLAICHLKTGDSLVKKDRSGALEHFRIAVSLFEKLAAASPENARVLSNLRAAASQVEKYSR